MAGRLGFAHQCKTRIGWIHPYNDLRPGILELDHVRDEPMIGKTACSDEEHLVALCGFAHQTSHWATSHRDVLRDYLDEKYPNRR